MRKMLNFASLEGILDRRQEDIDRVRHIQAETLTCDLCNLQVATHWLNYAF